MLLSKAALLDAANFTTPPSGNVGDGKIFTYNVADVIKIRTDERGHDAI